MLLPLARHPARHGIALALTAFLGCAAAPASSPSRPAQEPPPSVASSAAAPAPTVAALPPLGPLVAPWIEQCFTWSGERRDLGKLTLLTPDPPPPGFRPVPRTRRGTALAAGHVGMRAYHFAGDRPTPSNTLLDSAVEGCDGTPLTPGGSLCPSVEAPGVDVRDEAAQELLAIADEKEAVPVASTCARSASLGFLLLDTAQRPVAEILVDPHCGRLWTIPARKPDGGDGTVRGARRRRLYALLDRLGLISPCSEELLDAEHRAQLEQQQQQDGPRYRERFPRLATGVDGGRSFASLTSRDWQQLCAWHALRWGRAGPGFECIDGWQITVQDFSWCLAHPPTCDATVGEVEACVEALKDGSGGCFEPPAVSHCKALRSCFWGYAAGLPGPR
jgi:hypothetical protein